MSTASPSPPSPTPITPITDTALLSELCPFCNAAPPKYRCPACDARTCSLACSKRHKTYKQCSGMRDPTAYLKRSALATPTALNRDFNFLSGVERAVLSADADGEEEEGGNKEKANRQAMQSRQAFIERSGVVVRNAPRGMKRAMENRTDVVRTKKQRVLCWTVEWIVCDEGNRRILDDRVTETSQLFHAFFHPNNAESRKKSKPEMARTHFYLRKVGTPANKPTLIQLNPTALLKDCLKGRTVEEYPTVYVTGQDGHPQGWEIDASIAADAGGKLEVLKESGGVDLDALEKVIAGKIKDTLMVEPDVKEALGNHVEEAPEGGGPIIEEPEVHEERAPGGEPLMKPENPNAEADEVGSTKDSKVECQQAEASMSAMPPESEEAIDTKAGTNPEAGPGDNTQAVETDIQSSVEL